MNRRISGVYVDGHPDQCFEDFPEERQRAIVRANSAEWAEEMIIHLAGVISGLGEKFNMLRESAPKVTPPAAASQTSVTEQKES